MTDTPGLLRQAVKEIGDEFFERREVVEVLVITLLSRLNAFMLGEPGTGKSALVRRVCAILNGGVYMDLLFDKQLPLSDIFGQYDPIAYKKTGVFRRNPIGRLPQAHMFFGDEIGKAGPAALNPLLTAINEHLWHDGSGKAVEIPLLMHVGASNEELEMPELAALWDRYMVRLIVDSIQEPANFQSLLWSAVETSPKPAPTQVELADLLQAINVDVPAIDVPAGVMDKILQLKADLRAESLRPSDRRWKQSVRLLQASAYLNGRTTVDDDDLEVLQYVLWDSKEFQPVVRAMVMSNASETAKWALEHLSAIAAFETRLDAQKGQSTADQAKVAVDINHKLRLATTEFDEKVAEAESENRSTVRIEQVGDQIKRVKLRVMVELMNLDEKTARRNIYGN